MDPVGYLLEVVRVALVGVPLFLGLRLLTLGEDGRERLSRAWARMGIPRSLRRSGGQIALGLVLLFASGFLGVWVYGEF